MVEFTFKEGRYPHDHVLHKLTAYNEIAYEKESLQKTMEAIIVFSTAIFYHTFFYCKVLLRYG